MSVKPEKSWVPYTIHGAEVKYMFPWLTFFILLFSLPVTFLFHLVHKLIDFVYPPPLRWTWDDGANPGRKRIDTNDLYFPKGFLWGTATAAHQIEGDNKNNNWYQWEQQKDENGKSRIKRGQKSGKAADHWNRLEEDTNLMKDLGCNSYRFSIEWSKIEPQEGKYDEKVLAHYKKEIQLLKQKGITPMVTLHHFTQPIWFDQKGGWEKRENLEHFVLFSEYIYEQLSQDVPYWCTFNEPTVFALVGWLQGSFPPGKRKGGYLFSHMQDAVRVLQNLLIAHVMVYKQLKAIDPKPKIGLVHNIFNTNPYRRWHPIDYIAARVADQLQNQLVLDFLRTGDFKFRIPVVGPTLTMRVPEAPQCLDFIGLNYYSHMFYKFSFDLKDPIQACAHPEDYALMTDMEYPVYPEGFYLTLMRVAQALPNLPIYVTENGVADDDDSRRLIYLKRYLYALSKAIQEGANVKGYYYWTLMDNFEWAFGVDMRFGLYEVDFGNGKKEGTFDRKLREGSKYFQEVVKRFT